MIAIYIKDGKTVMVYSIPSSPIRTINVAVEVLQGGVA